MLIRLLLEVKKSGQAQKVLDIITPVFNIVYLWSDQRKWILIQGVNSGLVKITHTIIFFKQPFIINNYNYRVLELNCYR